MQYTAYGMAALIPTALFFGSPFKEVADYTLAVGLPAHMYLGLRSILIDYVPDAAFKRIAIAAAGGVSALTVIALLKLNITDVGITDGVKLLWKKGDE